MGNFFHVYKISVFLVLNIFLEHFPLYSFENVYIKNAYFRGKDRATKKNLVQHASGKCVCVNIVQYSKKTEYVRDIGYIMVSQCKFVYECQQGITYI